MKALSIRQPWAWLITHGLKPVENRTWSTAYRGELLIHASKEFDQAGLDSVLGNFPHLASRMPVEYSLGCVVGVATVTDCVQAHHSPWFTGPYGFVLRDAKPLQPRPFKGALGLFEVPDELMTSEIHKATPAEAEAAGGQERLF